MRGDFTRYETQRQQLLTTALEHFDGKPHAEQRATKAANTMFRKQIGNAAYQRHMNRLHAGWTYKGGTK